MESKMEQQETVKHITLPMQSVELKDALADSRPISNEAGICC